MFITKKEYMDVSETFFKLHHGSMVKLTAPNRKNEIYGYILRCEANANDKKLLVFSIISNQYYSKLIPFFSDETNKPSIKAVYKKTKEVKYYGMKRVLEKWKKIKSENFIDYKNISDNEFVNNLKSDLKILKSMYDMVHVNNDGLSNEHIDSTCQYILKEFRMIEKYYKDTSDIKIVFL